MASALGGLSGAASGASVGSMAGPWGTAAGAAIGGLLGLLGGGGDDPQAAIARNAEQETQNQLAYQKALNAIAMQRAVAGSKDTFGSTSNYDPGSNSWITALGPEPLAVQRALDNASRIRNGVEVPMELQNNEEAQRRAYLAIPGANAARLNLENYRPITPEGELGDLQNATTIANHQAQDPVIQQTLREFARTGTAAGPVLTQMMRGNADQLRKEMSDNVVRSQTDAANVNNANYQGLASKYNTLTGAATPGMSFAPISGQSPNDTISSLIANRAAGSAGPASQGAFGTGFTLNGIDSAAKLGIGTTPSNNALASQYAAAGKNLANVFTTAPQKPQAGSPLSWLTGLFGGGDTDNGDAAALSKVGNGLSSFFGTVN